MSETIQSVAAVLPDVQNINEIISCILAERINKLDTENILQNHTGYQESLSKYQRLQKQNLKPEADFETVDEIESCRNFMRQLCENAAYLQGMKDGLSLLAFAGTDKPLTLFGAETFCLNNMETIVQCMEHIQPCARKGGNCHEL